MGSAENRIVYHREEDWEKSLQQLQSLKERQSLPRCLEVALWEEKWKCISIFYGSFPEYFLVYVII